MIANPEGATLTAKPYSNEFSADHVTSVFRKVSIYPLNIETVTETKTALPTINAFEAAEPR
ncbi:hypothetical protein MAR_037435 [Mya arenaria]|uniref:Uncharacterized protein n=1 Tax=Mya arenaria TaxID=6604 RepID=A0ABY7FSR4_MYAAR|nr:hypothetical protein MAR_037435 [Mya arenaria]